MLSPSYTKQFGKDLKRTLNRGKSRKKIREVLKKLINEEQLDARYKDHKLLGNFKNRRECHVEPDWLLIYEKSSDEIIFERTGTHSDLYK
jgi:mRNA interferase YafQ